MHHSGPCFTADLCLISSASSGSSINADRYSSNGGRWASTVTLSVTLSTTKTQAELPVLMTSFHPVRVGMDPKLESHENTLQCLCLDCFLFFF